MKKIIFILMPIFFLSCSSYLDMSKAKVLKTESLEWNFDEKSNVLKILSRIPSTADGEVYYPQKFQIYLPKQIKSWSFSGNNYVVEYPDGQIIGINSGYVNNNNITPPWVLKNSDSDSNIYSHVRLFLKNKYKIEDSNSERSNKNRVTKLYTNGEMDILLFNIKEKNFDEYLKCIKKVKYID